MSLTIRLLFLLSLTLFWGCAQIPLLKGPSSPSNSSSTTNVSEDLSVKQTDRGVALTIAEKVFFDTGKYQLRPESKKLLDKIATLINDKTQKDVVVEGHTDNQGGKTYNQKLSERRAKSVYDALLQRGVVATRLRTQGYGLERPITTNATPEGRKQNRRVEIYLLGEKEENLADSTGNNGGWNPLAFFMEAIVETVETISGASHSTSSSSSNSEVDFVGVSAELVCGSLEFCLDPKLTLSNLNGEPSPESPGSIENKKNFWTSTIFKSYYGMKKKVTGRYRWTLEFKHNDTPKVCSGVMTISGTKINYYLRVYPNCEEAGSYEL